jgi:hypothetical protein
MKLAISARPSQGIHRYATTSLEVASEASEDLVTQGSCELEDWWLCQAFSSLEELNARSLWRPFRGLIGS